MVCLGFHGPQGGTGSDSGSSVRMKTDEGIGIRTRSRHSQLVVGMS